MKYRISFLLILGSFALQAQEDCTSIFNKVVANATAKRKPAAATGFDISCSVRMVNDNNVVQKDEIEMKMMGTQYYYKAGAIALYQDEQTLVIVNAENRSVFLTRPMPDLYRQNQFDQISKLQDSVLRAYEVRSCAKEYGSVDPDRGYYKLVMQPGKNVKEGAVQSAVYWVTKDELEIKKIQVHYSANAGYGIKEYEMLINHMKVGGGAKPFQGRALEQVLVGTKLKESLATYQLIDKRY